MKNSNTLVLDNLALEIQYTNEYLDNFKPFERDEQELAQYIEKVLYMYNSPHTLELPQTLYQKGVWYPTLQDRKVHDYETGLDSYIIPTTLDKLKYDISPEGVIQTLGVKKYLYHKVDSPYLSEMDYLNKYLELMDSEEFQIIDDPSIKAESLDYLRTYKMFPVMVTPEKEAQDIESIKEYVNECYTAILNERNAQALSQESIENYVTSKILKQAEQLKKSMDDKRKALLKGLSPQTPKTPTSTKTLDELIDEKRDYYTYSELKTAVIYESDGESLGDGVITNRLKEKGFEKSPTRIDGRTVWMLNNK